MVADRQYNNIDIPMHRKQLEAMDLLAQPDVAELLYGGAKGGGKSIFGTVWCFVHAIELINEYDLPVTEHPIPVGFMGRKRGVDFTDTTLESWKQYIPSSAYQLRPGDREIIIDHRVKLFYGGTDDPGVVNKFNSAEFAYFFLDQAEEVSIDQVGLLRGTLRLKLSGRDVPTKVLLTANPAPCWLKREFVDKIGHHQRFVRALPTDNSFLHKEYIAQLRRAFAHRPEILAAYLDGSWTSLAGLAQIIQDTWIANAKSRTIEVENETLYISCDPARFGDDETVMYLMQGSDIVDAQIYGQKDLMETAGALHIWALEKKVAAVAIDGIGIGAGVVDRVRQMAGGEYAVYEVNSAERATEPTRYINQRAEMWDQAARDFAGANIDLSWDDPELDRQLTQPQYDFRAGKLLVQAKSQIKADLGGSPDRADAYIQGLYIRHLVPIHDERITGRRRDGSSSYKPARATSAMAS